MSASLSTSSASLTRTPSSSTHFSPSILLGSKLLHQTPKCPSRAVRGAGNQLHLPSKKLGEVESKGHSCPRTKGTPVPPVPRSLGISTETSGSSPSSVTVSRGGGSNLEQNMRPAELSASSGARGHPRCHAPSGRTTEPSRVFAAPRRCDLPLLQFLVVLFGPQGRNKSEGMGPESRSLSVVQCSCLRRFLRIPKGQESKNQPRLHASHQDWYQHRRKVAM